MRGVLFSVLALASCERQDSRPAEEPCLADHVGWLREWQNPGDCSRAPAYCRTACAGGDEDACFRMALEREWHDEGAGLTAALRQVACATGVPDACDQ